MPYNKRQILQPILDKIESNWEIHQFKADNDVETVCIFRKLQGLHHHGQAEVNIPNHYFRTHDFKEIERLVKLALAKARMV